MREALSFLRSIPRDWLLGITLVLQARTDVYAARAGVEFDDEWRASRAAPRAAIGDEAVIPALAANHDLSSPSHSIECSRDHQREGTCDGRVSQN